jgi:hypothetical protein
MPALSRAIESNLTPQRVVAQWAINLDEPVCPSTLHLMAAGIVHQKFIKNETGPNRSATSAARRCIAARSATSTPNGVALPISFAVVSEGCFAAIDHADYKTHARQPPCRCQADAARGTGDDGYVSLG